MRRFEHLDVYNLAHSLSRRAYRATMTAPFGRHLRLAEQIRGASASIPANIAEGYALGTKPQLIRHLRISLGSAEELKCHLALAVDVGLIGESGRTFINDSDRLIGMLIGLLKSLGAKVPSRSRFPLPPSRFPASH